MSDYGLHILPQHANLLEQSAISLEVARDRSYVSVDTKKRLENLGFVRYQRSVPGLLISGHRADGSVWGYQYRPDEHVVLGYVCLPARPTERRSAA